MCHQYGWRGRMNNSVIQASDPIVPKRRVPVFLLDAAIFRMVALPQRLPMLRAGVLPSRQDENGGFHLEEIVMQTAGSLSLSGALGRGGLSLESANEICDGKRFAPRIALDGLHDGAAYYHAIREFGCG